jgi:hypothetical protein
MITIVKFNPFASTDKKQRKTPGFACALGGSGAKLSYAGRGASRCSEIGVHSLPAGGFQCTIVLKNKIVLYGKLVFPDAFQ